MTLAALTFHINVLICHNMNWDWEKLQKQRQGQGGPTPPGFDDFSDKLKNLKGLKIPGGKIIALVFVAIWLLSGIYIVAPAEVGVVKRFGEFSRITPPGPHYHIPFPVESVLTPNVEQVRRMELGFRSLNRDRTRTFEQGQSRKVEDESLMLTGDENIVDIEFIVQYKIKDAEEYLFNVKDPDETVKKAAEAAMREIIGKNKVDEALTTGKMEIQNSARQLMQEIMDMYKAGVNVVAVQLANVHPPNEVVEAFKDVASAREDKSRYINEADAYRNDILPKARGQAAVITNQAEAYAEAKVRKAEGDAAKFLAIYEEYSKARDVTRKRLYLETMEKILSNPELEKLILSDDALQKAVPYLPLSRLGAGRGDNAAKTETQ